MFLDCRRGCACCKRDDDQEFVEAAEPDDGTQKDEELAEGPRGKKLSREEAAAAPLLTKPRADMAEGAKKHGEGKMPLQGILKGHKLPQEDPATALPGQLSPDSPAQGAAEEYSPNPELDAKYLDAEKPAFAPLEEDLPIFELDAQRLEAATAKLVGFRQRVEAELLEGLQQASPERSFCSDATLLRYLSNCDGSEKKALAMVKETVKWRSKYFAAGSATVCPCCQKDPRSHCFLNMGKDAAGRHVVYSCAGRASNKTVAEGMRHMSTELERMFDGNSATGQIVWVVDFAGFGLADCNPRMGATAVPMFASHYPERFAQIVLFAMPTIFRALYHAGMKLLDPVMQRKVVILHTDEARRRYAERYWSCNPPMAEWLQAVANCKGAPGSYPDISLGRCLGDATTRDILERCEALRAEK